MGCAYQIRITGYYCRAFWWLKHHTRARVYVHVLYSMRDRRLQLAVNLLPSRTAADPNLHQIPYAASRYIRLHVEFSVCCNLPLRNTVHLELMREKKKSKPWTL